VDADSYGKIYLADETEGFVVGMTDCCNNLLLLKAGEQCP